MTPTDTNTPDQPKKLFPPWSPVVAVIYVIAAYFGASIGGQLILLMYAGLQHWDDAQLTYWADHSVYAPFFNSVLVYGLLGLAVYVFTRGYKVSVRALGLVSPRFRDIGIALMGVPVYILGYVALVGAAKALFPALNVEQQQQLGFQPATDMLGLLLTLVSLVVLPPLVEELLMRGFVFTSLLKRLSFVGAALLTSALFAVGHLQLDSGSPPLWIAAIDTFMLSLVLCYMRYKTGSLWPCIFLHAMKNGVAFVSIFILHLV